MWRKNFQCRSRWIINKAANIRLVLLCMVTHWFFAIPRYVIQPLPLPPPSGNMKYRISPETSDGMNMIRQPMSTSALMVMRFMKNLISYQDCAGKKIFSANPAYVIPILSNPVWWSIEHEIGSFFKSLKVRSNPASSFLKVCIVFHSNLSIKKILRRKK